MREAFLDLGGTVDEIVAEGDHVAMRVALSSAHRRQFMEIDPTGESLGIEHAIFLRFEDRAVVELWGQLDAFGFRRQLGVFDHPTR